MTYHQQYGRFYGHMTVLKSLPFVVMQRVAWVYQRQLSYLFYLCLCEQKLRACRALILANNLKSNQLFSL